MDEEVVFVNQKSIGKLILENLFSEETEKFYKSCAFTSDRMAFMQGMNYAALLCSAKLEQYPVIIHHQSNETEENLMALRKDGICGEIYETYKYNNLCK